MSKAACMFICRLRTEERKFSSENCTGGQRKQKNLKPGYIKPFLYRYLPLLQLPACLLCHQCWQGKDITLVSNWDKFKQCKWWLLLSTTEFAMCSFASISYQRASLAWAQPPSIKDLESQQHKLLSWARDSPAPGQGRAWGEPRAETPHALNLVFIRPCNYCNYSRLNLLSFF